MSIAPRFVLLDRDGVLNQDRPESVRKREDMQLIPKVAQATARLRAAGYQLIVITNQACIGRGDTTPEELFAIHERMIELLAKEGGGVDDIFICPHLDADDCDCRKPEPGLLKEAARIHGFDLQKTWFVGDAGRDVEAAWNAGAMPALVKTGKGLKEAREYPEVPLFDDLDHFARHLLSLDTP